MKLATAGTAKKDLLSFGDKKWGSGELTALYVLTVLIPLIGIIVGILGLFSTHKKKQGVVLIIVAVVLIVVYLIAFSA